MAHLGAKSKLLIQKSLEVATGEGQLNKAIDRGERMRRIGLLEIIMVSKGSE